MPIATSWVQYQPASPFSAIGPEVPFLDLGTVQPGATSLKFVVGLKFQGLSVQNITVWMDQDQADIYPADGSATILRQGLPSRGYTFNALVINETTNPDGSPSTANNIATFNGNSSAWGTLPSPGTGANSTNALVLGAAMLTPKLEANSVKVGLTVTVPSGEISADIRNFRLLSAFDTTDTTLGPSL